MSTITAQPETPPAAGAGEARRGLWQVPTFLVGVTAILTLWAARPLWYDPEARRVERELARARELLERPQSDLDEVLALTADVLDRADRFPHRVGEAYLLIGSAYLHEADRGLPYWDKARESLHEAELRGVPEDDQLRLAYRLGKIAYHEHEDPQRVVDYLARSVDAAADDPAEGYGMLAQAYLRLPKPDLQGALQANQKQLDLPTDNEQLLSPARLLRGRLLLQLHQPTEAHKVLRRIRPQAGPEVYYTARYLLAGSSQEQQLWDEAAQLWKEILDAHREPAGEKTAILYSLGLCDRQLGRTAEADQTWLSAARSDSGEAGRACAFRLAELRLHGTEPLRAVEAFELAFQNLTTAQDYGISSRVSLAEARKLCEAGCRTYCKQAQWEAAQKLAALYERVAPGGTVQALFGQIADGAARSLQEQIQRAPAKEEAARLEEAARVQLARAAAAYESAAQAARESSQRADWLWLSADRYFQIHDGAHAASVLERFLKQEAGNDRHGEGWYRLAETRRAVHDDAAALEAYRHCLEFPSKFANRARYRLALAEIEQGKIVEAEKALQENLERLQRDPDPEAHEQTLFALAGLLFQGRNYLIASLRLEEALEHYPASAEAVVARRQLADCYRRLAAQEGAHLQLTERTTADAQLHYRRQYRLWLEKAAANYQKLEDDLLARETASPLSPAEAMQLRDASFSVAECRFDLGTNNYDEAIRLYEALAKRYEKQVEGLNALVQITRCYWIKNDTEKARETLLRIRTVLAETDDATLQNSPGAWTRQRWEQWLQEASRLTETSRS
jgi:tetratricopeptide (TPR) repeat protein